MKGLSDIEHAVEILRAGGLVAFPTETVYGLGADASNPRAVRRIFEVKGRPAGHPVIVHLPSAAQLPVWARTIPQAATLLAERFWPGPLTLILARAASVIDEVTGGQDTVGLRVPAHPLAQALLRAFAGGIAAPSANRFGRISPTVAQHVRDELGEQVDLVLDGGPCEVGIESTIVDLSSGVPRLLRPGRVRADEIEATIGMPLERGGTSAPRAPGTLAAHYAPRSPLLLVPSDDLERVVSEHTRSSRVAVYACRPQSVAGQAARWVVAPTDALSYAHELYAVLRALDRLECDLIVVEAPPPDPAWAAVRDRLQRAAAGSGTGVEDAT